MSLANNWCFFPTADRVTFVETDFVDKTWLQALTDQGSNPALPTFFLWEGVTHYLPAETVDAKLREVGQLAPGIRIAFFNQDLIEAKAPFEKLGKATLKNATKIYANEPLLSGIPNRPPARESVEQFVASHGLELADYEPFGAKDEPFGGLAMAICRGCERWKP